MRAAWNLLWLFILYVAAVFALLAVAVFLRPVFAQTFEAGLINSGPLATEITHRVRAPSMPGAVYVGAGIDGRISKYLGWTVKGTYSRTVLEIERCDPQPCEYADRDHRPVLRNIVVEPDFTMIDLNAGLRLSPIRPLSFGVGLSLPVVECPYAYCGAQTMIVRGYWGDFRVVLPLTKDMRIGVTCTATVIPPQTSPTPRWTTLSEWSGYKQNGGGWLNDTNGDPLRVEWRRCGLVVGV